MEDELRKLIEAEYSYRMSDELFDCIVERMTEIRLKNREALIRYGKLDSNLYIHKSGIIRMCWMDGEKEKTYGFSNPGDVIISYFSHFMHRPSYFQFESCGESVVMKLSEKDVDELVKTSHEFAQWVIMVHASQLYFNELRFSLLNGTAKESYMTLLRRRPYIIEGVPQKVIASYLGVTSNYLSTLKKEWLKNK